MEKAYLHLYMDLTDKAPEGAGWYLGASLDGQPVMAPIAIEADAALRLSRAFTSAIETSESEIPNPSPIQIILSGNSLIRAALQHQLDFAEEQATLIAKLRRKLEASKTISIQPQPERQEPNDQN